MFSILRRFVSTTRKMKGRTNGNFSIDHRHGCCAAHTQAQCAERSFRKCCKEMHKITKNDENRRFRYDRSSSPQQKHCREIPRGKRHNEANVSKSKFLHKEKEKPGKNTKAKFKKECSTKQDNQSSRDTYRVHNRADRGCSSIKGSSWCRAENYTQAMNPRISSNVLQDNPVISVVVQGESAENDRKDTTEFLLIAVEAQHSACNMRSEREALMGALQRCEDRLEKLLTDLSLGRFTVEEALPHVLPISTEYTYLSLLLDGNGNFETHKEPHMRDIIQYPKVNFEKNHTVLSNNIDDLPMAVSHGKEVTVPGKYNI